MSNFSAAPLTIQTLQAAVSCTDQCSIRRSGLGGTMSRPPTPEPSAPSLICEQVNLKIQRVALQEVQLGETRGRAAVTPGVMIKSVSYDQPGYNVCIHL